MVPSETPRFAPCSKGNDTIPVSPLALVLPYISFPLALHYGALLLFPSDKGGGLVPHVPGQWDITKALAAGGTGGRVGERRGQAEKSVC